MRKLLVVLLLAACAIPVFADDAVVLPAGVLRVSVVPAYAWADKMYGNDGKLQDLNPVRDVPVSARFSLFNLGFVAEYSATDWMSVALQWSPGWYAWSDITVDPNPPPFKLNANGLDDLFAGAKIQIIGERGLVANNRIRVAVAPGVRIPLPDVDWDKQLENLNAEKDTTIASLSKHALGVGARGYFDYIIDEMFFVNFFTEYTYLFERKNAKVLDLATFTVAAADINYGYELTFEIEPHFQHTITDDIRLEAGLPLRYKISPKVKIDGVDQDDTDTALLSIKPNISAFFVGTPIPIEAKLQFSLPLWGKNAYAFSVIDLELRAYLAF